VNVHVLQDFSVFVQHHQLEMEQEVKILDLYDRNDSDQIERLPLAAKKQENNE
jgi:hypothetical protein